MIPEKLLLPGPVAQSVASLIADPGVLRSISDP